MHVHMNDRYGIINMLILIQLKKSLNQVNWNQLFQNKNVDEQVVILNNFMLNIF